MSFVILSMLKGILVVSLVILGMLTGIRVNELLFPDLELSGILEWFGGLVTVAVVLSVCTIIGIIITLAW